MHLQLEFNCVSQIPTPETRLQMLQLILMPFNVSECEAELWELADSMLDLAVHVVIIFDSVVGKWGCLSYGAYDLVKMLSLLQ